MTTETRGCTATTKAGKACPNAPLTGQSVCVSHSGQAKEYAVRASAASVEARRDRVNKRQEAVEASKLTFREGLAARLNASREAVYSVLVDEAIATSDRATLLRALDQAYGKPLETVQTNAGDPFNMTEAELAKWLNEGTTQVPTVSDSPDTNE